MASCLDPSSFSLKYQLCFASKMRELPPAVQVPEDESKEICHQLAVEVADKVRLQEIIEQLRHSETDLMHKVDKLSGGGREAQRAQ